MNSSGDIIRCVVPSRQAAFTLSNTWPAALHCIRSSAPQRAAACRLKPSMAAGAGGAAARASYQQQAGTPRKPRDLLQHRLIGYVASYNTAHRPGVQRLLPMLQIPPLPCWLAVHREFRGSEVVRRVCDFLAEAIPRELALTQ